MFKVAKKRIVKNCPAVIAVALDEGRVAKYEVEVDFEILPHDAQEELYRRGAADIDLLKRTLAGWKTGTFKREDDSDIEFSPEGVAEVLTWTNVRIGLMDSYLRASAGREAARKN